MLSVEGFSLPIQAFCGSWLLFYLLGLEWKGRIGPWLRDRGVGARHAFAALVVCLAMQELEGFAWLAAGNYDLATTQLKATSLLSSLCACALVALASGAARQRLASCWPLVRLGDLSFGVYLCHMAVLMVCGNLFELTRPFGFLLPLLQWVAVLCSSAAFVTLSRCIFPKRILGAIGFA